MKCYFWDAHTYSGVFLPSLALFCITHCCESSCWGVGEVAVKVYPTFNVQHTRNWISIVKTKVLYNKTMLCELKEEQLRQEARSKMNNLIFSGIPEVYNERNIDVLKAVTKQITKIDGLTEENIFIERCYRVGSRNSFRPRDIFVAFLSYKTKQKVSAGRSKFTEGVNVRQDLPPQLSTLNRALMPIKRAADKMPKYKDMVHVSLGELIIKVKDGKDIVITLRNLEDVPNDIRYNYERNLQS